MIDIPGGELPNDPLPRRPLAMAWETFIDGSDQWSADPQLAAELASLIPDTTDGVPLL